jgi:hypothetical protein
MSLRYTFIGCDSSVSPSIRKRERQEAKAERGKEELFLASSATWRSHFVVEEGSSP